MPEALQTGHSQWPRLYPPWEAIPRGPSLPSPRSNPPWAFPTHCMQSLRTLIKVITTAELFASFSLFEPCLCLLHFWKAIYPTDCGHILLKPSMGKNAKNLQIAWMQYFWWGLGYRQNNLLPGLFSTHRSPSCWWPSSIFPWKKILGRQLWCKEGCSRSWVVPTSCGKRVTGQMMPSSWVLGDSSRGILRSMRRKNQKNLVHAKHGHRDFGISRATQCFCQYHSSNRLRRRESDLVCLRESETPIIIAGPFRPVQCLIS